MLSPGVFNRPGARTAPGLSSPVLPSRLPSGERGGGAPEGAPTLRLAAGAPLRARARRLPALHLRLFCPRGSASGRGRDPQGPPIRAAFAALRPRRVQPLKAAPHSGGGLRPGASRSCGYKPQQRAPPPPHARQCPAERPSRGWLWVYIPRNLRMSRGRHQTSRGVEI